MKPEQYMTFKGLENLYLEDSFVLEIDVGEEYISFAIDAVLTENHPLYTSPRPSEKYCYRRGTLRFNGVASHEWRNRNMTPTMDVNGTVDYGNIDQFYKSDGIFHLSGDWGDLKIVATSVSFCIVKDTESEDKESLGEI